LKIDRNLTSRGAENYIIDWKTDVLQKKNPHNARAKSPSEMRHFSLCPNLKVSNNIIPQQPLPFLPLSP
jgi:hypothetical protein